MAAQSSTSAALRLAERPWHPFLTGALIPLNFVAAGGGLFAVTDALRPSVVLGAVAALLMLAASRFVAVRDAAVLATFFVVGINVPWVGVGVLAVHLAAMAALGLLLRRRPVRRGWTSVFNAALLAMLAVPLWTIGTRAWVSPPATDAAPPPGPFERVVVPARDEPLPSIVHIVLDGYAGASVLQSVFRHENGEFFDGLRQLGFTVAEDARTPYNQTLFTMASIFYGDYLPAGQPPLSLKDSGHLRRALGEVVTDGPVHDRLRAAGYRLLFTDTGYGFFTYPADAVVDAPKGIPNPLELELTGRHPLDTVFSLASRLTGGEHYGPGVHRRLTDHAWTTDIYRAQRGPFLLYQHVIAPHPPFNVEADGSATTRWQDGFRSVLDGDHATGGLEAAQRAYQDGYLAKLRYVNASVLRQLPSMIQEIPAPKVIVIHGDHGSGSLLHHDDPSRSCLKERFSTFLAVYSDDAAIREAFAGIASDRPNVINLYRTLFDARFGAALGPLTDRSYFVRWQRPQRPELLSEPDREAACVASIS